MVAHAAVFGTGHTYLTALLALDPAVVRDWAAEQGRSGESLAQLAHDDELIQTVALSLAYTNRDLPKEQRVRAFTIVGEEWVRGSALLSFDSKPQRAAIAERYAADLDAMFDGDAYVAPVASAPAPLAAPFAPETDELDDDPFFSDDELSSDEPVSDPTIPPFVTEQHTVPPRPAPPKAPPASTFPSASASSDGNLVDPTPSWSAVLRPERPLAPKDPSARRPQPAAAGGAGGDGMQFTDEPLPVGDEPDDSRVWDEAWQEPRPPAKRWWWAVLIALVVVAAGALVVKTVSNNDSGDESATTEVLDTTPDTVFEDPDTVDTSVVDTTPETTEVVTVPAATDSLLVTVEKSASLTTFLAAIKAAGIEADLTGTVPVTVFAPTDEAFKKLDPEVLTALLANKELLTRILRHHIVDGSINAENLTEGNIAAHDGTTILVATTTDITLDKNARPVDTDIPAANGVLHTIDTVLLPPDLDPATIIPTTTLPAKLLYTVYFGTSTRNLDDTAKAEIESAAEAIKALPADSVVTVTGYTMKSGTAGHRKYLAKLRANTVIKALKKAGATNVTYKIVTVIDLPRSGDKELARRAEIALPGYDPTAPTTTVVTSTTVASATTTTRP